MRKERFVSEGEPEKGAMFIRFVLTVSISFTVVMAVAMAMGSAFAPPEAQAGIMYSWSILAACALAAAFQMLLFTDLVFKRMSSVVRMGIFGGCLYGMLAVAGAVFKWFPVGDPGAWITFTAIYLIVLAALAAAHRVVERNHEREYAEQLKEYRSARDE